MAKEAKTQVKVQVGIEAIWKALAKDLRFVLPRIMPSVVKDVQVIEGDGGLGTVFLFNFGSGESIYFAYIFPKICALYHCSSHQKEVKYSRNQFTWPAN